jgi:ABC-type branched-subunit amino acid transport system substrate-binding protein
MSRKLRLIPAIAAASSVLVLAACSSSTSSSSAAGGAASSSGGASSAANFTGPDIALGIMRPVDAGLSYPDGFAAAQVAADAINAAGGIRGHKVVIDTCDDKNDPNVASSCANTLINTDHVAAMVGSFSEQADSLYPDLAKAGTIDFCNDAISSMEFTSPLSFPCIGGISAFLNISLATKGKGYKTAAMIGYGDVVGKETFVFVHQGFASGGITNVQQVNITDTQVDVSPVAAKLEANRPDVVVSGLTDPLTVKLMETLASAGKKYPLIITSGSDSDIMTSGVAQAGYPVTSITAFGFSTSTFKDYLNQVAQYGGGKVHNLYEDPTVVAWLGVTLFAKVAATLPDMTPKAFTAAISKGSLDTGVTPPLSWAEPGPLKEVPRLTNVYGTTAVVQNGKRVQAGSFGTGVPGVPSPASQPS